MQLSSVSAYPFRFAPSRDVASASDKGAPRTSGTPRAKPSRSKRAPSAARPDASPLGNDPDAGKRASGLVVGPYGDLISPAEYEALTGKRPTA
jgi:hypothetical protein